MGLASSKYDIRKRYSCLPSLGLGLGLSLRLRLWLGLSLRLRLRLWLCPTYRYRRVKQQRSSKFKTPPIDTATSSPEPRPVAIMSSVVVAVKGVAGGAGGKASRRAVRWAVENLMPESGRFILVHVMPKITYIPTPSGEPMPIEELDENVVAMYVDDMRAKFEEVFVPFKKLCKTRKMETLVLEDDDPAAALLRYISEAGITSLVLGSCSSNFIARRLKGPGIPTTILKCATSICNVYVVSRDEIINKPADTPSANESNVYGSFEATSISLPSYQNSLDFAHVDSSIYANEDQERNLLNLVGDFESINTKSCNSFSTKSEQSEVEQLQVEIQNTVVMYKRACEELAHAQNKVQIISSACLEEARRVNDALEREETLRKIAAEEKAKYLKAMEEVEEARNLLAKEAYEKKLAEVDALRESMEKQKIVDALFSSDRRYRRYTRDEIEAATDLFSEINVIGEGGYGKVYKCSLHHTPVAVKVLRPDAIEKKQGFLKEEFLKEVEVLSQLRHPHLVLLLGACPETGCLVYEYLENGSLEEYLFHQNGKPPLPWFVRFRIVFEVACGLAFLHNSKPDPIVHRDLKPANILLDRNYVSKIADVGLAKLISDVVPDNITEYNESLIVGTLYYLDPEYQRTGTVRPKSDVYAFGIIILQLLTDCHPNGLIMTVENAIMNGSLPRILDKSVKDWPLAETEELARIALKCSKLRCRDRPDLETDVLPVLKRLNEVANASVKVERYNSHAPNHYFCPILQEIMSDPHIAADGFTYEYEAIMAWLMKHNVSPVTKLKLQHSMLTPNHTLRSAIQEWRSRMTFSSA
ncbi:U-box domain-containing protein 34 isoform X2 [Quercus robur]|uniref:U-box domain-containing protein 34 isoform X2 n=1 Tax=Quercus robur TaxID=38942 RepID=UPI002162321C|nr:U-box domain-containing protein 34 isoform X2 [Quercus robur]